MLYLIIRVIFCLLVMGIVFIYIKKTKKIIRKSRAIKISFSGAILLFLVLEACPVENLFVDFSTPEAVFSYSEIGAPKIDLKVEGEKTTLILYSEGSTIRSSILPKSEKGWKIKPRLFYERKTSVMILGKYSIRTYSTMSMSDTYVIIDTLLVQNDTLLNVTDNRGSIFSFSREEFINEEYEYRIFNIRYAAYVTDFDDSYELYIDGEKVPVKTPSVISSVLR